MSRIEKLFGKVLGAHPSVNRWVFILVLVSRGYRVFLEGEASVKLYWPEGKIDPAFYPTDIEPD